MPNIKKNTRDQSTTGIDDVVIANPQTIVPYPVLLCGVSRLTNVGNYENVDIFSAVGIPIMMLPSADNLEAFKEAATEAARIGFNIVSEETGSRYQLLKSLQEGEQQQETK